MKNLNRDELMDLLATTYPKMFLRTTEEFNGSHNGIWTSGEDGLCGKNGLELFDYWNQDYKEIYYQMGVNKELVDLLDNAGWYYEHYDSGTIMIYQC